VAGRLNIPRDEVLTATTLDKSGTEPYLWLVQACTQNVDLTTYVANDGLIGPKTQSFKQWLATRFGPLASDAEVTSLTDEYWRLAIHANALAQTRTPTQLLAVMQPKLDELRSKCVELDARKLESKFGAAAAATYRTVKSGVEAFAFPVGSNDALTAVRKRAASGTHADNGRGKTVACDKCGALIAAGSFKEHNKTCKKR